MDQATHQLANGLELLHQLAEELQQLAQRGEVQELARRVTELERLTTPAQHG